MVKIFRFFLIFLIVLGFFVWYCFQPKGGAEKIFVINKGDSVYPIAERLEKEKIIRNKFAFLVYLKLSQKTDKIQAGSFRLSGKDSFSILTEKLSKGRLDKWVIILEGWRAEEVAEKLGEELSIDGKDFLKLAETKEGYLFPDSYLIPEGTDAEKILEILTRNFEKKWQELIKNTENLNLTKKQIVILASLVEREAKDDNDRKTVAGILLKRWESGWPLQVDATAQYIKAGKTCLNKANCDWWPKVSSADLKIKSSFNTYLEKGLPPSPICNPSFSSLSAAVNPTESDYWYYLSDKFGKMHYGKTLAEHNENIEKYL